MKKISNTEVELKKALLIKKACGLLQKENHFKVNCKTKIQGKINLWHLFHLVPQVRVELILEWFLVYLSSAQKVTGLIILKLLTERNWFSRFILIS